MNEHDDNEEPDQPKMPVKALLVWLMVLATLVLVLAITFNSKTAPERKSWSEFQKLVEAERVLVAKVVREGGGKTWVKGVYKKPGDEKELAYEVEILPSEDVINSIIENPNIPDASMTQSTMMLRDILATLLPLLVFVGLLYFIFVRQMKVAGKGAMSFGKSRARMLTRNKNKVTFKDVAGAEEAREEMEEIIDFLKDPKKFQRLGGRIPKGVLLVGPPGTGKTLLAKAIAGEADVPFFSISGSDFVEMFVGVGASRVRDMFEQGRKHSPCLIFIDEIDAVGRSRFSGIGGGHDEREQTLNALLVEMDGFDSQEGVIIIAATNRPDVLDNALLRPGRFDRQIHVDLPTLDGRKAILEIHGAKVKLGRKVDLSKIARGTPGFSGADLANLVNEAALLAARRDARAIDNEDLEAARDKVAFGVERRSRMLDDEEKELTAYHEAGHAIVMALQDKAEPVHKVTIIPRGQSLGSTMQLPEKDNHTRSKKALEAMLVSCMGGRAAEEIVFKDITTGAAMDLKQSTRIARAMVCQFGMDEELGPQAFGENEEHLFMGRELTRSQNYSGKTAELIDERVRKLLTDAYSSAKQMLIDHREALDTMARLLIEHETISGEDVDDIIKHNRIRGRDERDPDGPRPSPEPVDPAAEAAGGGAAVSPNPPPYPPPETSPA